MLSQLILQQGKKTVIQGALDRKKLKELLELSKKHKDKDSSNNLVESCRFSQAQALRNPSTEALEYTKNSSLLTVIAATQTIANAEDSGENKARVPFDAVAKTKSARTLSPVLPPPIPTQDASPVSVELARDLDHEHPPHSLGIRSATANNDTVDTRSHVVDVSEPPQNVPSRTDYFGNVWATQSLASLGEEGQEREESPWIQIDPPASANQAVPLSGLTGSKEAPYAEAVSLHTNAPKEYMSSFKFDEQPPSSPRYPTQGFHKQTNDGTGHVPDLSGTPVTGENSMPKLDFKLLKRTLYDGIFDALSDASHVFQTSAPPHWHMPQPTTKMQPRRRRGASSPLSLDSKSDDDVSRPDQYSRRYRHGYQAQGQRKRTGQSSVLVPTASRAASPIGRSSGMTRSQPSLPVGSNGESEVESPPRESNRRPSIKNRVAVIAVPQEDTLAPIEFGEPTIRPVRNSAENEPSQVDAERDRSDSDSEGGYWTASPGGSPSASGYSSAQESQSCPMSSRMSFSDKRQMTKGKLRRYYDSLSQKDRIYPPYVPYPPKTHVYSSSPLDITMAPLVPCCHIVPLAMVRVPLDRSEYAQDGRTRRERTMSPESASAVRRRRHRKYRAVDNDEI